MEILRHEITSYVDIEILFENPQKFGFDTKDVTWGEFTTIDDYDDEKQYYQEQLNKLLTIDYEERDKEWLIPGYMPKGCVTLLCSDGGIGKTTIWCDTLAAFTTGRTTIFDKALSFTSR